MLKGKELGAAIGEAIRLKVASGSIVSKADVAKHFGIKTPSIYDWIKKGSISKDRLFALWSYFSDVVGPEHWGIQDGLYQAAINTPRHVASDNASPIYRITPKTKRQERIDDLVDFANNTNDEGLAVLLFKAREIASEHPFKIEQTL